MREPFISETMVSMSEDQRHFLMLANRPARLTSEQTAWLLGFNDHDIPVLVLAGMLKPLGHPLPNTVKYFAETEVLKRRDQFWLGKASDIVRRHWKKKNSRRHCSTLTEPEPLRLPTDKPKGAVQETWRQRTDRVNGVARQVVG